MNKYRVDDIRAREMLELAAAELASVGRDELADDLRGLLTELIPEPVGCKCCGGKQGHWTTHCIHCNPGEHLTSRTAAALKACSWASTPVENMAIISKAVIELEAFERRHVYSGVDQLSAFMGAWEGYLDMNREGDGPAARFTNETVELAYVSWCKGALELGAALYRLSNQRGVVKELRKELKERNEVAAETRSNHETILSAAKERDDDAVKLLERILKGQPISNSDIRNFLGASGASPLATGSD
jgi:hypothetical protein